MSHKHPLNAQRIEVAEREAKALDLRKAGLTYDQIGAQLGGISRSRAAHIVRRALDRLVQEPGEELVKLEVERLDMLWRALLPKALAGSPRHAEVAVRVLESKRKLLGVDAPTKTEAKLDVTVVEQDQTDREIEQLLERMRDRDPDPAAG
jgi:hypothetical protein